jgi:hypothetical protein
MPPDSSSHYAIVPNPFPFPPRAQAGVIHQAFNDPGRWFRMPIREIVVAPVPTPAFPVYILEFL